MAARFWVGGTGTWDAVTTTNWSATTGGGGGASVPVAADTVALDGLSGGGVITVSTDFSITSLTLTGYTGTLDLSVNNNSPTIKSVARAGSSTMTLKLGTGTWTINGTGTIWSLIAANLTLVSTGSQITLSPTAACTFAGGGLTYGSVTFNTTQTTTVTATNTYTNFSYISSSSGVAPTLAINNNFTVTGTFTLQASNSASVAGRLAFGPVAGAPGTATLTITAAAVSLQNVDFAGVTGAGAATWSGTELGDAGFNSNITFATPKTRFWVGGTGNWLQFGSHWSTLTGGVAGASQPLCQDTVVFDTSSFTANGQSITGFCRFIPPLDFSAVTKTISVNLSGFNPCSTGSFAASATTTVTNTGVVAALTLMGAGNHTITMNGGSWTLLTGLAISTSTGTYTLQDDLTLPTYSRFTVGVGTFDANNHNISAGQYSLNGVASHTINMGNGLWTITGDNVNNQSAVIWDSSAATGLVVVPGTSTIVIADTSANAKLFTGGGKTFANLSVTGGGAGVVTLTGNNGWNSWTLNGSKTVSITAGNVNTLSGTFTSTGTLGNVATLNSVTPGSVVNLVIPNSATATFSAFQDINANAGASIWAADGTCTDNGNNHNVIFNQPNRLATQGVG